MGHNFDLESSQDGEDVILRLHGELDLASRDQLVEAVNICLHQGKAVMLELGGLVFIDSSGLSALVRCRNIAARLGRPFSATGATGQVAQVLELTGIGQSLAGPMAEPST